MITVTVLSSVLIGCGNNQTSNQNTTEDAMLANLGQYVAPSATENPAVFLSLVRSTETDSSVVYIAKSLHDQDTIGLQIEVNKDIQAGVYADGEVNEERGFSQGTIKFSTIGEESNRFVAALAAAYKQAAGKGMTSSTLQPHVFSSNKTVVDLTDNGTYSFKLSFENSLGEGAEVFATLDLFRRAFEFRAKDVEQHSLILSAFIGE